MNKLCALIYFFIFSQSICAQQEQVISPSNGTVASLEKNILFYANKFYPVTQSGSAQLPMESLFDGRMDAVYTNVGINPNNPYVILIENLPDKHTQRSAWVGWSTRYYAAKKFKIEVYDQWNNNWVTIADINNHNQGHFIIGIPGMSVGKIRYTFYETVQNDNLLGLSELFFIHPEAAQAYDNLLLRYNELGNVGIGTATPKEKLAVNGSIRAHEIKVEATNWPDYVFEPDYKLLPLKELENYVKINKHLPDMPKADAVEKDGVHLGEMINKLLKKNEELTLYILSLQNQIDEILKTK